MFTLLLTFLTFAVEDLLFCWYVKQEKCADAFSQNGTARQFYFLLYEKEVIKSRI